MQKTLDAHTAQEKNPSSRGRPSRAKPIPRHLVRICYRVAITRHGQTADLGFLLAIEAGRKLKPGRFFALVALILREG